jgi:aspartate-semialdehyde dehydrogenase
VPAQTAKTFRVAIVGSETLRGKEIKSVLSIRRFPLRSLEFYDPGVDQEFSKLTQFREEPKVVHHLEPRSLAGLDLVFLAADVRTDTVYGELAGQMDYRAIDLSEAFNTRREVPVVVAGVNDAPVRSEKPRLIANPNPVTIILSHLFQAVRPAFGIAKAVAFVLEPVSAFEEEGIRELADQSFALLGGSSVTRKVFRDQIAFNLLSRVEKSDANGFSVRERRVLAEVRRVMHPADFPLSLSIVLAPVFHTYSIMTYLELEKDASIAGLEARFRKSGVFKLGPARGEGAMSSVLAAGKDKILVGPVKKEEDLPRTYWVWAVADNLTLGSAVNAYEVARSLLGIAPERTRAR